MDRAILAKYFHLIQPRRVARFAVALLVPLDRRARLRQSKPRKRKRANPRVMYARNWKAIVLAGRAKGAIKNALRMTLGANVANVANVAASVRIAKIAGRTTQRLAVAAVPKLTIAIGAENVARAVKRKRKRRGRASLNV